KEVSKMDTAGLDHINAIGHETSGFAADTTIVVNLTEGRFPGLRNEYASWHKRHRGPISRVRSKFYHGGNLAEGRFRFGEAIGQRSALLGAGAAALTDIKLLYCFHQGNDDSKCEATHTSFPIRPSKSQAEPVLGRVLVPRDRSHEGNRWDQNQLGSYLPSGWR